MTKSTRQQPNKSVGESEISGISGESYLLFKNTQSERENKELVNVLNSCEKENLETPLEQEINKQEYLHDETTKNLGVKVTIFTQQEYDKYKLEQPVKVAEEENRRIDKILEIPTIIKFIR